MKAPAAGLPNVHQERTVDNVDEEVLFAVTVEVALCPCVFVHCTYVRDLCVCLICLHTIVHQRWDV